MCSKPTTSVEDELFDSRNIFHYSLEHPKPNRDSRKKHPPRSGRQPYIATLTEAKPKFTDVPSRVSREKMCFTSTVGLSSHANERISDCQPYSTELRMRCWCERNSGRLHANCSAVSCRILRTKIIISIRANKLP